MMARTVSASAPACISIRSSPISMLAAVPGPCGEGEAAEMRGRLIVLEGTDGSGKATQAGLLLPAGLAEISVKHTSGSVAAA